MAGKPILFHRQIVDFKLISEISPDWLKFQEQVPIFINQAFELSTPGQVLASFKYQERDFPACIKTKTGLQFAFDVEAAISDINQEAYFTRLRPLSSRLWFNYQRIPVQLRIRVARGLYLKQRFSVKERFPQWPVDKSVEVLNYLKNLSGTASPKLPWPAGKQFSFIATHDLETEQGFADLELLRKINNDWGVKTCVNITAKLIESHPELVERLKNQGCEIGCHGYNHDNKFAFLSPGLMRARMARCARYIDRYQIKGFRSPSLLRSDTLIRELANHFAYDSSYPDTDLFSETGRPSGCCMIRPFYLGGILELPITLAMDSSLLFMGCDHQQMLEIWLKKVAWIKQRAGMALINIHCHRPFSLNTKVYQSYALLLESIAKDPDCWRAGAGELAGYWKEHKTGKNNENLSDRSAANQV